ncbi:MAG: 2-hydroxyglutaryl-CoA dehydratase [Proteobacteria bacterium]|nr:2-hydroxyglutaryl-CoA dehydratase [Pseudomonadota bacterium]
MLTVGIDIGSITTKIALMDKTKLIYTDVAFSGYDMARAWQDIFKTMLLKTGTKEMDISCIVSTGYGRGSVGIAHKKITEISCHAAGAAYFYPDVKAVIDIGGQDSKCITLNGSGTVSDFVMNDKCAAGTGRFLDVMARALHVELGDFGAMDHKSKKPVIISSMCTVFAESEVISMIARGESRENIIAGIHESIASRMVSMMNRIGVSKPLVMTGGVSRNKGMRTAIEKKIGLKLLVPNEAQVCGAIGAAILGGA